MADFTVRNDHLTARVSSHGAELQSVTDAHGRERLWQGDPKYWTGRAPVLFPFAGGLKNGYFTHGGRRYDMPEKHGFALNSEFRAEQTSDGALTLLLDAPAPNYPFAYEFRVKFSAEGEALNIGYHVKNAGDQPMLFGLGAHEAYALAADISHYALLFDEEERFEVGTFAGGLLTRETVVISEETRRLALSEELMRRFDTVMLKTVRSRGVTLVNDVNDQTVRVEYPYFPYLLLWKKPGARYLCIEPWLNPPEYVDGEQEFSRKTGITTLAPGEERAYTHRIILG